jgi:hypothetical protein
MNNIPHVVDTGASALDDEPVAWRIKSKDGTWLYYDEPLVGTEPLYTRSIYERKYSDEWWKSVKEFNKK